MTSALAMRRRAMGKAGPVVLASDDFSEADGTNLHNKATDTPGVSWTVLNGSFTVTGNKAHGTSGASGEQVAWVPASQVIGSVEVAMTASAGKDDGITIRVAGVDVPTMSFYLWRISAGGMEMFKRSAGGWTALGSWAFAPVTGATYILKLSAVGSAIKGYVDGTERLSVTDGALPDSDTRAGLRLQQDDARVDDLKVVA